MRVIILALVAFIGCGGSEGASMMMEDDSGWNPGSGGDSVTKGKGGNGIQSGTGGDAGGAAVQGGSGGTTPLGGSGGSPVQGGSSGSGGTTQPLGGSGGSPPFGGTGGSPKSVVQVKAFLQPVALDGPFASGDVTITLASFINPSQEGLVINSDRWLKRYYSGAGKFIFKILEGTTCPTKISSTRTWDGERGNINYMFDCNGEGTCGPELIDSFPHIYKNEPRVWTLGDGSPTDIVNRPLAIVVYPERTDNLVFSCGILRVVQQ